MSTETNVSTSSCVFKSSARRVNVRMSSKRRPDLLSDSSSSSSDDAEPSIATFRTNPTIKNGLITTSSGKSSNKRHRQAAGRDDGEDRTRQMDVKFKSDRQVQPQGPRDMGATATLEIDTDTRNNQQTIFERAKKINHELEGKADDKIYRGMNNYQQFYEKKDTALGNASSGLVRNKGMID
jgi:RING finger protein 113A